MTIKLFVPKMETVIGVIIESYQLMLAQKTLYLSILLKYHSPYDFPLYIMSINVYHIYVLLTRYDIQIVLN